MQLIPVDDLSDLVWGILQIVAKDSPVNMKLGAALTRRGKVVAKAFNTHKTNPSYSHFNENGFGTTHAEMSCIYRAKLQGIKTLKGLEMYVYRRHGCKAKPCPKCEKALKEFGIKRVYYSNVS